MSRIFGLTIAERLVFNFSGEEPAGIDVRVISGKLNLVTVIDGKREESILDQSDTWDTGPNLRVGITRVELAPVPSETLPTVTFDIGEDAGHPGSFVVGAIPPIVSGSIADQSGTINNANASEQIMPSNALRRYLYIENIDGQDMWVNFDSPAVIDTPGSSKLASGESLVYENTFIPTDTVTAISGTANHKYTAREG